MVWNFGLFLWIMSTTYCFDFHFVRARLWCTPNLYLREEKKAEKGRKKRKRKRQEKEKPPRPSLSLLLAAALFQSRFGRRQADYLWMLVLGWVGLVSSLIEDQVPVRLFGIWKGMTQEGCRGRVRQEGPAPSGLAPTRGKPYPNRRREPRDWLKGAKLTVGLLQCCESLGPIFFSPPSPSCISSHAWTRADGRALEKSSYIWFPLFTPAANHERQLRFSPESFENHHLANPLKRVDRSNPVIHPTII